MRIEWPPAAATSRARRAAPCPRTSARSGPDGAGARGEDGLRRRGAAGRSGPGPPAGRPRREGWPARAPRAPARAPASAAFAPRHHQPPPSARGPRARPWRARPAPAAASRRAPAPPSRRRPRAAAGAICPDAARIARASGQVVLRPGLAEVGGREVGDDPARRHGEGLVREPGADALARLLHRRVGQPDHRERRKARPAGPPRPARSEVSSPRTAGLSDAGRPRRRGWQRGVARIARGGGAGRAHGRARETRRLA